MFDDALDVLATLVAQHPVWVYTILVGSAALEYVFPPFPGDTVAVAGALLVAAYGWSFWGIFAAVTFGSALGAAADYWVGVRWALRRARRGQEPSAAMQAVIGRLRRHGAIYISVNRFLPGIRALFFVAAGLAGLSFWRVMLWGVLSAAAWNAILMGAAYAVGANLPLLQEWVSRYTRAVGALLLVLAAAAALAWWRRRRRLRAGSRR